MDGLQDATRQVGEAAQWLAPQPGDQGEATLAQVSAAPDGNVAERAHADYEVAPAERDALIAELEGEIAEAAKTAESAKELRVKMDDLRRMGDEEHVGTELQLAGARKVKAARAFLSDHDNDIEKLKATELWLFSVPPAPAPTGATGLPSAGAAGPTSRRRLAAGARSPAFPRARSNRWQTASRTPRTTRPSWTRSTRGPRARRA